MEHFGFYDNTSDENGSIHPTNSRNQAQLAQKFLRKQKKAKKFAIPFV